MFYRLCANLCRADDSKLEVSTLFSTYQQACAETDIEPIPENVLSKIIKSLYDIKKGRPKIGEKRVYCYSGITFKVERDSTIITPCSVEKHLTSALILSRTLSNVNLIMPSDLVTNGNIVMKEVKLDFQEKLWNLTIRNKSISLNKLFVSKQFECTAGSLGEILHIVSKIKICKGKLISNKQNLLTKAICETLSLRGDENRKAETRLRCNSCCQALTWCTTGEICKKCNDQLGDSQSVQIGQTRDDLLSIFQKIFPNASPEMQTFLQTLHHILTSNLSHTSLVRWDKSTLKLCLNLWSKGAKVYEDLRDSQIYQLPSGRHLRRLKNRVTQRLGINDECLERMYNTALANNLPPWGHYGGIIHDEAKIQQDLVINVKGKCNELVGWIDTGEEAHNLNVLGEKGVNQSLATVVLQLTFLGN